MSAKLPTLLDNRSENTVLSALQRLLPVSKSLDIATGTFEVGALLALDSLWQHSEKIRILMGDETTRRTKREILTALTTTTSQSIEAEKERDDSLADLAAVRASLADKKISVRVYSKAKFHAKAYLMETNENSLVDFAVVGSSNFTRPGLTQNLELNLLTTDQVHIQALREWYAEVWKEGEEANFDLLRVIEPHLKEYGPFEVYAKALYEFFAGREKLPDDWEVNDSVVYPLLSQYQKDGYHTALRMAERWGIALICDGVGLGKTFIGLMLLERHVHDRHRVLLIVPKSTRESVWERYWKRTPINPNPTLAYIADSMYGQMFRIHSHTDFGSETFQSSRILSDAQVEELIKNTDVIIIDEAHHFRNPNTNRGRHLMRLAAGKKLYMLTATPINNRLDDLYHLINYSAQGRLDHFARVRVNNLRKHFLENEKRMEAARPDQAVAEVAEAEDFLRTDELLRGGGCVCPSLSRTTTASRNQLFPQDRV